MAKELKKRLIRERSAVCIQKLVRGFLARKLFERMQEANAVYQRSTCYPPHFSLTLS